MGQRKSIHFLKIQIPLPFGAVPNDGAQSNMDYWRMGWDSNPRGACTPAGFQDRCLQPLGHPSLLNNQILNTDASRPESAFAGGFPPARSQIAVRCSYRAPFASTVRSSELPQHVEERLGDRV